MAVTAEDMAGIVRWREVKEVPVATWVCGYCGNTVSSKDGWSAQDNSQNPQLVAFVRICPSCKGATFFTPSGNRSPGSAIGEAVPQVPPDLSSLYDEARQSASVGAYTASVLACRKILMHIAVEEGAPAEKQTFQQYVEYLAKNGYVPPKGKVWVDYIRTRSNEANHEVVLMKEEDARALITFVEMLLRFIYEFPSMVPTPASAAPTS